MEEEPGQRDEEVGREDTLLRKKLVRLTIAVGTVLAVALLVLLGLALRWYLSPQTALSISQRQDLVQGLASAGQALAVLLTGAVALIGLYLTRQNTNKQLRQARESTQKQLQQARESQERTQASAQETLRLTEQGQITERFTRAIEQLGATDDKGEKKLEIRLGGIYALERIARDSPERDYSTVMEVLTAYVRENTSQAPAPSNGSSEAASPSNEASAEADEGAKQAASPELRHPTADVQAILDVLRRAQARVSEEHSTRLDLHEAFLRGANLREADLQTAKLLGVNLQRANLRGALLNGANLQEANLEGAILQKADLRGANLRGANLREANLEGAVLYIANLQEANLQEANLQEAKLIGAKLQRANLEGAILQKADLQGANLLDTKVTDEQLADTRSLQGATKPDGQKYEDWIKGAQRELREVSEELRRLSEHSGSSRVFDLSEFQLQQYLRELNFPATKEEVASNAERNDAPQELVQRIRNASTPRFNDPDEVLRAVQGHDVEDVSSDD